MRLGAAIDLAPEELAAAGAPAPLPPPAAKPPEPPRPQLGAPIDLSPEELAAAIPVPVGPSLGTPQDPLDDFGLYDALETARAANPVADPADPGIASKVWQNVTSFLGDVKAAGTEALRLGGESIAAMMGGDGARYVDAQAQGVALATETAGKLLGGYKTLAEGAKAVYRKADAWERYGPNTAEMQRASRKATWDYLREQRDVDAVTGKFNSTLESIFPQALKGLTAVPVDQRAAAGMATVADPANYVPVAAGANWSLRAPLQGAVNAARASLGEVALKVAESTARRDAATVALKAPFATTLARGELARQVVIAGRTQAAVAAERDTAQAAFADILRRQAKEIDLLRERVPLPDRLAGGAMQAAGGLADRTGALAEKVATLPDALAAEVAPGNEAAAAAIAGGVRNITGAFGVLPAAAGVTGMALRTAGRDLRVVGRLLAEAEGQLPFFRRVAKETGGLTSFAASLVDTSGAAPLVTALGRSASAAVPAAGFMGALGFMQSGGDVEQIIPSAGVGAFLGMSGAGFGQWRRYANADVVKVRQGADAARYRGTLLPDQTKWYDALPREDRTALASYAHAHPDLQIRYSRLGKDAAGFWYLGDDAGVAVINLDSKQPLRAIVAHEVGHHVAAHGLDGPIQRILLGDEAAGTPGLYTMVDSAGKPVAAAGGGWQTTPEFQRLAAEYNAKIKQTAQASGRPLEARSNADVAREIFAEHAADYLLQENTAGTRLARDSAGYLSDRLVRRLAETELVNTRPFLRDLLAKSGAIFNGEGRVIGSELFGGLGRSPELGRLVRQYHERAARERSPGALDDGEHGGLSYDAAQIRAQPHILDKLFDGSGDVARGPDGKALFNADGTPRFLTEKEQQLANRTLTEKIFAWREANPAAAASLRLEDRPKKGGGTEPVIVAQDLPASLLKHLAEDKQFNPVQLGNLAQLTAAVKTGQGNTFAFFYQPAVKAGASKSYRSLKGDWRTEAPYAIEISKAGNIFARTVSKEKLIANAQKALKTGKGPAAQLWPTLPDLLRDTDTYLANHAAGRGGAEGIGAEKRDVINELFGVRLPGNAAVNPLFDSLSRKPGDIVVRSRRLDRINKLTPVDEQFRVDYQKVKQNLRPAEPGDSASDFSLPDGPAADPAAAAWAAVKPGADFDKVKRLIPKAPDYVPTFAIKGPENVVYQRIKGWLELNPVVRDADGRRILLAASEGGGADRLFNRARHLASVRVGGQRSNVTDRIFDENKARLIPAIPRTLADYHAKLERHGNHLYFRRYADGTLHMVVVDPNSRVTTQGLVDGSLITQYSPEGTTQFKDGRLVRVRAAGQGK